MRLLAALLFVAAGVSAHAQAGYPPAPWCASGAACNSELYIQVPSIGWTALYNAATNPVPACPGSLPTGAPTGTIVYVSDAQSASGSYVSGGSVNTPIQCNGSGWVGFGASTTFQVNNTPLTSSSTVNFVGGTNVTITNPSAGEILITASSTGATAFSALTTGTNTTAAMLVGTGASLGTTGSGSIAATTAVNLASYPTLCTGGQYSQGLSSGSNNCGTPSGSTGVSSFNSRTGAVSPTSGDYSFSLLSGTLGTAQGPSGLSGLLYDATGTLSAASAAQVVAVIGTTAVANATNLASYPSLCTGGQFSQGLSSGSNNCGTPGAVPLTIQTITTSTATISGTNVLAVNTNATAGQAVTATLPTPAAGDQVCIQNFNNGSAANTGTLELLVANTGTQSIVSNGTVSSSGYVISGGAAGDLGCVIAVSSTQWSFIPNNGSWVLH